MKVRQRHAVEGGRGGGETGGSLRPRRCRRGGARDGGGGTPQRQAERGWGVSAGQALPPRRRTRRGGSRGGRRGARGDVVRATHPVAILPTDVPVWVAPAALPGSRRRRQRSAARRSGTHCYRCRPRTGNLVARGAGERARGEGRGRYTVEPAGAVCRRYSVALHASELSPLASKGTASPPSERRDAPAGRTSGLQFHARRHSYRAVGVRNMVCLHWVPRLCRHPHPLLRGGGIQIQYSVSIVGILNTRNSRTDLLKVVCCTLSDRWCKGLAARSGPQPRAFLHSPPPLPRVWAPSSALTSRRCQPWAHAPVVSAAGHAHRVRTRSFGIISRDASSPIALRLSSRRCVV